jgi:hypothetical protein
MNPPGETAKVTILVVEHNKAVLNLVALILKDADFEVLRARSASHAMIVEVGFRANPFAAILRDIPGNYRTGFSKSHAGAAARNARNVHVWLPGWSVARSKLRLAIHC